MRSAFVFKAIGVCGSPEKNRIAQQHMNKILCSRPTAISLSHTHGLSLQVTAEAATDSPVKYRAAETINCSGEMQLANSNLVNTPYLLLFLIGNTHLLGDRVNLSCKIMRTNT